MIIVIATTKSSNIILFILQFFQILRKQETKVEPDAQRKDNEIEVQGGEWRREQERIYFRVFNDNSNTNYALKK